MQLQLAQPEVLDAYQSKSLSGKPPTFIDREQTSGVSDDRTGRIANIFLLRLRSGMNDPLGGLPPRKISYRRPGRQKADWLCKVVFNLADANQVAFDPTHTHDAHFNSQVVTT